MKRREFLEISMKGLALALLSSCARIPFEIEPRGSYKEIQSMVREYGMGRKARSGTLDKHIDRISGLRGVSVSEKGSVIKIKYGGGEKKLLTFYGLFPFEEPSTVFSWIESVKVAKDLFPKDGISYVVLINPTRVMENRGFDYKGCRDEVEQICDVLGEEVGSSRCVILLKGETYEEGARIVRSTSSKEGRKVIREIGKMGREVGMPFHNFARGRVFDPEKDKDYYKTLNTFIIAKGSKYKKINFELEDKPFVNDISFVLGEEADNYPLSGSYLKRLFNSYLFLRDAYLETLLKDPVLIARNEVPNGSEWSEEYQSMIDTAILYSDF